MVWLVLEKSFEDFLKFIFPSTFLNTCIKCFATVNWNCFDFEDYAMWYIM